MRVRWQVFAKTRAGRFAGIVFDQRRIDRLCILVDRRTSRVYHLPMNIPDIPELVTPRLRLRAFRRTDFDDYAAMWSQTEVVRFIGGVPVSREAAWSRFLRHVGAWQYLGFGFFAIEEKASGAFIGEAGFHDLHRSTAPSVEGTMETGWALSTIAHGKGLAEEATRAALAWADREHGAKRRTCIIHPDHVASLHIAAKLGFAEFARAHYNGGPVVLLERTATAARS